MSQIVYVALGVILGWLGILWIARIIDEQRARRIAKQLYELSYRAEGGRIVRRVGPSP
jgi:hypothetical protein